MKQVKKSSGSNNDTNPRKFRTYKGKISLPELPAEVSEKLRDDMHRGDERTRTIIHEEGERTVPEAGKEKEGIRILGNNLEPGCSIRLEHRVKENGDTKKVAEDLFIERKLSGKRNVAGDVWLAKRYWDGEFYGNVVLKKPKDEHKDSEPDMKAAVHADIEQERKNLLRFEDHPNILSPSGISFRYNDEPVIQMEYQPWSFSDYLEYFKKESELTAALTSCAIQTLSGISYMANKKDDERPLGWTHVDFKKTHIRLDYRKDETGHKGWIVTIIDLDSVRPAGPREFYGIKYNRACVNPEKAYKLHDPNILITAEPSETVYSLGISLLYAMAIKFEAGIRVRAFDLTPGLAEKDGKVILTDEKALRSRIIAVRAIDEMNLLKIYYVNKFRRIMAGKFDQDPEDLKDLIEKYKDYEEVKKSAVEELKTGDVNSTVNPIFFVGIRECLRPDAKRLDAGKMQELFEALWDYHLENI